MISRGICRRKDLNMAMPKVTDLRLTGRYLSVPPITTSPRGWQFNTFICLSCPFTKGEAPCNQVVIYSQQIRWQRASITAAEVQPHISPHGRQQLRGNDVGDYCSRTTAVMYIKHSLEVC